MAMAEFAVMLEKERERLGRAREDALARRSQIDKEIVDIDKELAAIVAYERAKQIVPGGQRRGRSNGTRRGSRQESILSLLRGRSDGLTRGQILQELGLKGDKSGEQSISNALNNMKKSGKIASREGRYVTT
jgi:hypothetical protein